MNFNTDLSNGSEWELSKENVQPLKKGRKVANLTAALGSSSNDYQSKIHREKQAFEADIRTYEGDDLLEVWYRYFLWLCQNFPTGGKDQTTLLERCITVFKDEEKYKNDQRYLEIWMRYADLCSDPMEVYEYMCSQSVCSQLSNFYTGWAYVLEELGNVKKADEVYTLGISKNAQPLDVLQRQHRAFERRLAENMTRYSIQNFNDENETQRTALGGLKAHGKKGTVEVKRTGRATLSSKAGGFGYSKVSGNSKNAGFTVYCEDENMLSASSLPPSNGEWQVPPTKPISTKENTQKPAKWTESKLPQKHQRVVSVDNVSVKPSFTVHIDDEVFDKPPCTPQHGHVVMDKVLSSRKPEKDPTTELLKNIAKGDNEEKKFKVMYCKDKIYAGAREFSFEQLRAARMFAHLAGRPWSSLYPKSENQDDKQYKVMYPKEEVYTFDHGERPYEEVLLKQYFKHKKARQERAQSTGAAMQQVATNAMNDEHDEPMDYQQIHAPDGSAFQGCHEEIENLSCNGQVTASFQVYNEENKNLAMNVAKAAGFQAHNDQENHSHTARRGLSFIDTGLEGQSRSKDDIFQSESPNINVNSALPTAGSIPSAFHPVPKGLQGRQALRDWAIPPGETCSTAVNTSNHGNRVPVTLATDTLTHTSNALNQQSAFHPVTPGNTFGRHTPGGRTPGSLDNYYPSPTVNTKAAQEAVLAMFNNPLGVDNNDVPPWMNVHPVTGPDKEFEAAFCNDDKTENIAAGSFEMQAPPRFTPYVDTVANTKEEKIIIYDENQENRPPADYVQEKPKRPVLGVLQPSVGIPVCPLEEENDEDMADEDEEYLPPQADQYEKTLRDVTEDTNAFKIAARMASTPFSQGLDPPSFVMSTIRLPIEHEQDFASTRSAEEYSGNTFSCTPNKVLSPIFERSDEDSRSTTGSSTSTVSSGRGSVSHHVAPTASQLVSIAEDERTGNHGNHSVVKQADNRLESSLFHRNEDGTTDLNPFSDEVVEALLQRVVPSVTSYDGYFSSREDHLPKIVPNIAVNLGDDDLYQVEQCIGTGAFSKVFCAVKLNAHLSSDDFSDDNEVTLKVQKTPNDWEFYICRQLHARIDQMECGRNMHALFMNPSDIYNYPEGSVLVDQYERALTLLDVVNKYKTSGKRIFEDVAVLFTISLLRMLRTMHRCNIIHGDFKPDNILVLDSESFDDGMDLKLIDFGRSIDLQLYPPGTSFNVNCYTDGFQCIEMKTKKPWTTQVDMYGLLGTVYCLIHGEYMKEYQKEGRWKQIRSFKRHWNAKLWTKLFDSFLNVSGHSDTLAVTEELLMDFEQLHVECKQSQQARKQHVILMNSS